MLGMMLTLAEVNICDVYRCFRKLLNWDGIYILHFVVECHIKNSKQISWNKPWNFALTYANLFEPLNILVTKASKLLIVHLIAYRLLRRVFLRHLSCVIIIYSPAINQFNTALIVFLVSRDSSEFQSSGTLCLFVQPSWPTFSLYFDFDLDL